MTLNLPRSDFIFQGQVLDCSWGHPCYICMHSWYCKDLWIKKDIKWHTLYANINDMTARVMVSNEHGRQKGNECALWVQSLQFNHTTSTPHLLQCVWNGWRIKWESGRDRKKWGGKGSWWKKMKVGGKWGKEAKAGEKQEKVLMTEGNQ